MVNQKLIAISYVCCFFAAFLAFIAYSTLPEVFDRLIPNNEINIPQNNATMSVTNALASVPTFGVFGMFGIVIVIMFVLIAYGYINTFGAY
ncbi:MAG: hypothetical protein WC755_07075 [Candidatus Woesearchaeota archaeon]